MATAKKPASTPADGVVVPEDVKGREELAHTTTLADAVEAGLLGREVDPRPNRDYTVEGVVERRDEFFDQAPGAEG